MNVAIGFGLAFIAFAVIGVWQGWRAGAQILRGQPNPDPRQRPVGIIWLSALLSGCFGVLWLLQGFGIIHPK